MIRRLRVPGICVAVFGEKRASSSGECAGPERRAWGRTYRVPFLPGPPRNLRMAPSAGESGYVGNSVVIAFRLCPNSN
jgi:hypothetical protein